MPGTSTNTCVARREKENQLSLLTALAYPVGAALVLVGGLVGRKLVRAHRTSGDWRVRSGLAEEPLVAQFIPSLAATLLNAERKKGAPLVEAEVLEIRDRAPVLMVTRAMVRDVDDRRGYVDIDPENCWPEYQRMRESVEHAHRGVRSTSDA